jgi:hypothetical protein
LPGEGAFFTAVAEAMKAENTPVVVKRRATIAETARAFGMPIPD